MKIADEEGWVMIDDHQDILDHDLTFGTNYLGEYENHDFYQLCEDKITTILEDASIDLYGDYERVLENAVFQELMEDEQFKDEFNKHFISQDHFDWIVEMTDQMSDLKTGDELATSGLGLGVPTVLIEKLHDGRWGVKSLEDKAVIREHAGDWFVSQRVVIIAEYPHVQMEEDFKRVATEMTGGKTKISVNF